MTTPPKGRKFRIRRGTPQTEGEGEARGELGGEPGAGDLSPQPSQTPPPEIRFAKEQAPETAPESTDARAGDEELGAAPAAAAAAGAAAPVAPRQKAQGAPDRDDPEIAEIKAEGLTGRQLRMARRTALKHGIVTGSDYDAVRQLRAQGIDPFARSNMLELIVSDEEKAAAQSAAGAAGTVPATRPTTDPAVPRAPGGDVDQDTRSVEIQQIQAEIAKRRRRRLMLLATRLSFFVFLPTAIAAYYFFAIATPLYATHSAFKIDTAESGGAAGGGGLLSGMGLGNSTDSIVVQEYLESREAMLRLDAELDFRQHFSAETIDPLVRLAPDASDEDMYAVYSRNLSIGFDPTEGLIRMEMRAADPEVSQSFSEALITYAEERVDQMSQRVRENQMADSRNSFEDAEAALMASQQRVLELQEQRGVLSTDAEVSTVFSQISTFELQLQEERLRLSEMQSVARPNQTRVRVAEENIARLEETIDGLRSGLTDTNGEEVSLARISSELIVAQADMETRQLILAQSLQQMEMARIEANRQSLYLSMSVYPIPPDAAAYPKAMENTLLTLLVFSGIYLMLSMTASILREQISA